MLRLVSVEDLRENSEVGQASMEPRLRSRPDYRLQIHEDFKLGKNKANCWG